jgi:hypothetical protein
MVVVADFVVASAQPAARRGLPPAPAGPLFGALLASWHEPLLIKIRTSDPIRRHPSW